MNSNESGFGRSEEGAALFEGTVQLLDDVKAGTNDQISVYADSNCSCKYEEKRKSRTGVLIRFSNATIYPVSKTQYTVLLRSTEGG